MPIRAQTRRDPLKGKNGFSAVKGFTLVELMIVLGILAIITSLALPSYRTIIEKRQVTSGAEQLAAFLSSVQMESVKRSENISVTYSRTDVDTWCIGVVSGITACDCTVIDPTDSDACVIDSQLRVASDANLNFPGIMSSMDGDGDFVFDPARGLIYDDSGLAAFDEAELELISENSTYALNVQVTRTGRIKICSDSDATKVPRFAICTRDILPP
jgi:prepilin-type N-terminal cleavage/methylation domain-containing protein